MTTDATRTIVAAATERDATDASGDAARVTYRTLMRGDATTDDRKAHVLSALQAAGLHAGIQVSPLAAHLNDDGTLNEKAVTRTFTPQRMAVLTAFSQGLSYTETAAALHLNVATVKSHAGNLYRIFGVSSKVEAVMLAVRAGVLPSPLPAPEADPEPAPAPRPRRTRARRTPVTEG